MTTDLKLTFTLVYLFGLRTERQGTLTRATMVKLKRQAIAFT